ncbi:MAG: PQQ-binding-like beta-propeller repeat protein, partial [Planctomycetota bacterium]
MILFLPALSLLALAAPGPAQARLTQGVTVLENRDQAALLRDARTFLEEGKIHAGLHALQQVLESDPDLLVRPEENDLLFLGARTEARRLLEHLEGKARQAWENQVDRAADRALQGAMDPPDPEGLLRVLSRYPGTNAASKARKIRTEILLDRGHIQQAAAGRNLGEVFPPGWISALPAPLARSPVLVPTLQGPGDPSLPLVRASGLRLRWEYRFRNPPLPDNYALFRMAIGGGVGYLTDSREVAALNLGTGKVIWRFSGPPGWGNPRSRNLFDMLRGFHKDTLIAPVLEDGIVVAALTEPVPLGRSEEFSGIRVRNLLPGRRLYAFDAASGKLLWRQEVDWLKGEKMEPRGLVAAPPAAAAGRVFVPLFDAVGKVDLFLQAFDLYTGTPLWKTFLVSGQQESNLFGNVLKEMACGAPAADAEKVVVCTNLGAVAALDAATGEALWTRVYERTPVRTYQDGHMAYRPETFANTPPAFDGNLFFCTPTDSPYALALDARSGELERIWPVEGSRFGRIRALICAFPFGALFLGNRLSLQTLRRGDGRGFQSPSLFSDNEYYRQRHLAVLARDEVLVPTGRGVERFQPGTGRSIGTAFSWKSHTEIGALQTAPGTLLVLHPGGVSAYASPDALLEALLAGGSNPAKLAMTLPFLEGADHYSDPAMALRVARKCMELAATSTNLEQGQRLRLVAARTFLLAGDWRAAGKAAGGLLQVLDSKRRITAAVVVLDAYEERLPASPLLATALDALEKERPPEVRRVDGTLEPTRVTLWKGRYHAAVARHDLDDARRQLVLLAQVPADDSVRVNSRSLADWAVETLHSLVREDPSQARALERHAAAALAKGPVTPGLLHAFTGTRVLESWLQDLARRDDLSRAEKVRLSAWLRDYSSGPAAEGGLLDPEDLFGSPAPSVLPPGLGLLRKTNLGSKKLLAAHASEQGLSILIQDGAAVTLALAGDSGDWRERARIQVEGSGLRDPALAGRVFLFPGGGAVLHDQDWWALHIDGTTAHLRLPGPLALPPHPLGRMAALLCRTGEDWLRLQIRDLGTGALFFDQRLPRAGPGYLRLLGDGEHLMLLTSGVFEGFSFHPLLSTLPAAMVLPAAPTTREIDAAVSFGNGMALPALDQKKLAVQLLRGETRVALPLPDQGVLWLFRAPGGLGWLLDTTRPGHGPLPRARIAWMGSGDTGPRDLELEQVFSKVPQVENRLGTVLPDPNLLVLQPARGPETVFQSIDLDGDAEEPGPRISWTTPLTSIPWRRLTRPLPSPVHARGGWVVPLTLRSATGRGPELVVLRFNDQGEVLDRFTTDWSGTAGYEIRTWL